MQSVRWLLAAIILVLPIIASGAKTVKRGPGNENRSSFEVCREGGKGGSLNSATDLYDWTCGNYNWSAKVGGIRTDLAGADGRPWYTDPTTTGGNSWTLTCTGDGTGNGPVATDPAEAIVCLHSGETITMYATADQMLAFDNTRRGGKVYLPEGIYHHGYCGQDDEGNANGCPILRARPHDRTGTVRKLAMSRGVELVGEGMDVDGPFEGGRTGTWQLYDSGADIDGDDDIDETDPYGSWVPTHGGITVGRVGSTSCALETNYGFDELGGPGCEINTNLSYPPISYMATVSDGLPVRDVDMAQATSPRPRLCIENVLANGGTCDLNRLIRCTTNAKGTAARTGPNAGGCEIDLNNDGDIDNLGQGVANNENFGDCEGWADSLGSELTRLSAASGDQNAGLETLFSAIPQQVYGDGTSVTSVAKHSALAHVGDVTATACDADGVYVEFRNPDDAGRYFYPGENPFYDQGIQTAKASMAPVAWEDMDNTGGGYTQMNFMPAVWPRRDSARGDGDADCLEADVGTANGDACDEVELLGLGVGLNGHFDYITAWYGGSYGFAYSMIDGRGSGFYTELSHSLLAHGLDSATDASGWWYHDNVWRGWDNAAGNSIAMVFANFSTGFRMERDKFIHNTGQALFDLQPAAGAIVRDIHLVSNDWKFGIIRAQGARNSLFDGITGHGNRAPLVFLAPRDDKGIWNFTISNVYLMANRWWESLSNYAEGLIVVYDGDISGWSTTGQLQNIKLENIHFSVHGDADGCLIWLDGITGDESDADNGLGRVIDDYRHELSFENITVERVSDGSKTGTFAAFCLATSEAGKTEVTDGTTITDPWQMVGGMPRWVNVRVDQVAIPDNRMATQTAAQVNAAFTCDATHDGVVVHIHDDVGSSGDCREAAGVLTGASVFTSRCICDGSVPAWVDRMGN